MATKAFICLGDDAKDEGNPLPNTTHCRIHTLSSLVARYIKFSLILNTPQYFVELYQKSLPRLPLYLFQGTAWLPQHPQHNPPHLLRRRLGPALQPPSPPHPGFLSDCDTDLVEG